MSDKLHFHGHVYENVGPAPCPMKGRENGLVATFHKGKPAWWKGGNLFVKSEAESKTDEGTMGWERRTR